MCDMSTDMNIFGIFSNFLLQEVRSRWSYFTRFPDIAVQCCWYLYLCLWRSGAQVGICSCFIICSLIDHFYKQNSPFYIVCVLILKRLLFLQVKKQTRLVHLILQNTVQAQTELTKIRRVYVWKWWLPRQCSAWVFGSRVIFLKFELLGKFGLICENILECKSGIKDNNFFKIID